MGILIPTIINAKDNPEIKILKVEKKIGPRDTDYLEKICNDWELSPVDVKNFFETAKPFENDFEFNMFDVYNCDFKGELLFNGIKKNYNINLGGMAFIYDSIDQQGYGCRSGECLKYVHYEKVEWD